MQEEINPVEAPLTWLISQTRRSEGASFNTRSKILSQMADLKSVKRGCIGIVSESSALRSHATVLDKNGEREIGEITSGSLSPTISTKVMQNHLDKAVKTGDQVQIMII